ncbi:MAG: GNAT family N-acetyltransferase [Rheinheimera sp.]|uniref:GNAT family N-acetyltransferase n=1 Tax=Arsukibacterium sp. UBA3155 TaxID=1946058 RepID=UPI000C8B524E|nr:GNAT family N-acetyltransferase [Arsukibacterium sp. UBA3155]MAD75467.1 GNAT family N-acetyltransferase [Rheinheimera sp.]
MSDDLITTWYLQYQGATPTLPDWPANCLLMEATIPSPELSQFLFCAVGHHWRWFSRLSWNYQQWLDYLSKDSVRTWVLYQAGTIAGFVELNYHPVTAHMEQSPGVELKFFGLLPAFTGQGLGPKLAQAAIALAQQWLDCKVPTTDKQIPVWLHTCSADHPAALATYQKAGFAIYQTSQEPADIPSDYAEAMLCRNFVYSRLSHFTAN